MPVTRDPKTGKWKIGTGRPMYKTKEAAERAYKGYLAQKYNKENDGDQLGVIKHDN